jgi:hypothetical protein
MLVGIVLPAKHPDDSFPCGIRFTELDEGEIILTSATTAQRLSDGVDVSEEILGGSDEIQGGDTIVRRLQGGAVGERYRVQMLAATSGQNIYRHWFEVPMIPAAL